MKFNLLLVLILVSFFKLRNVSAGCGYASYQRNPDGTYVVGGAYNGYQRNPDGSYVFGQCND